MSLPRDRFTFLFTDIERSSQLWEMHPQTMGRALGQHDDLMRSVFEEHRGHVFKTVGDAFCVAFVNELDAVNAAVAAQRQLAAAAWEETGPLRVRMALHSGIAELRDGDYFGQTLNRVARVLAAGHGGQTLLSRVTAETVRDELSPDMSLRDLGERRLKDLSQPERIFQLIVQDLPVDFPPLRSLEVLPNNLPAQVTSFVGRAREMADAKRLLGTTRMLTLTGPGGTGKTRLSLQVAAEVLETFPHGVWLVELATISDPALVPDAVASAIEIRGEAGRPTIETLADALRSRRVMLILDNCEHLVDACAQLSSALLRRCPDLKILASSREALNIEGERIYAVPSLPAPGFRRDESTPAFEDLAQIEAVQLFVERAAAVQPDFSLTPDNAPMVARICWRLDGIPLALELAAARVKVLSLPQILARLDDRFRLLSGGSRTALPRQQTLGALIDWSYDLLSEPERILLRRLVVFAAGRTLEMTEEVCTGDGIERGDVFDLLSALVDKSLLTIERPPEGEPRYTMLESVWDYADDKLTQAGEAERYRKRHLKYFVKFAEEAEPGLFGPEMKNSLERIALERPNLTLALRTSLEIPGMVEAGLRLAGALSRYWEVRSYLSEGIEHIEKLLARADDSVPVAVRAKATQAAGTLSWCQDRDDAALRHFREAQRLYGIVGNRERVGLIEALLGFVQRNEGDNAAARTHFECARAIGEELHSSRILATVLSGKGSLAADEGDFAEARSAKEQSASLFRALHDSWIVTMVTAGLGEVCLAERDYPAAKKYLQESIILSRDLGNKWSIPYSLEALADIYAEEGQPLKAVRLYGAASTQREAVSLAFAPIEHASYQQGLRRLHELVPEKPFDEAWNEGRVLDLKSAIKLAMDTNPTPERIASRR